MRDWERELARIDRQLKDLSDEKLVGSVEGAQPPARPAGAPLAAPSGEGRGVRAMAYMRVALALALGVGMLFWPWEARCGAGLAGYLAAAGLVVIAGGWSAFWTWRRRLARAHVLALAVIVWGFALAAIEVLPRVGYARSTLERPAIWSCT